MKKPDPDTSTITGQIVSVLFQPGQSHSDLVIHDEKGKEYKVFILKTTLEEISTRLTLYRTFTFTCQDKQVVGVV